MIQALFHILGLFMMYKIYISTSYNRALWFLTGLLLVPPGTSFLGKPMNWFIILACLAGVVFRTKSLPYVKKIPVLFIFLFFIVSMFIIGIFDVRIPFSQKLLRPILYCYENLLPCFLLYLSLAGTKDYKPFLRGFLNIMAIFSVYGIFTYVIKFNPYINILATGYSFRDIADEFLSGNDGRVRTSSLLFHPYLYGIILIITSIIANYLYVFDKRFKRRYLLYIILFLINIFLTNSRTVLIVYGLASFLFVLSQLNTKNIIIMIFGAIIGYTSILLIPTLNEKVELILDLAQSGGKKVQGSSVEMRQIQLLASYRYFLQKPWTGNGFNYLYEGIGFRVEVSERVSDEDLYAFESYFYILLIEQGVPGLLANLVLFVGIFIYLLKSMIKVKSYKFRVFNYSCILILLSYLIYILATGTINSLPFFFSFLGIILVINKKFSNEKIPIEVREQII